MKLDSSEASNNARWRSHRVRPSGGQRGCVPSGGRLAPSRWRTVPAASLCPGDGEVAKCHQAASESSTTDGVDSTSERGFHRSVSRVERCASVFNTPHLDGQRTRSRDIGESRQSLGDLYTGPLKFVGRDVTPTYDAGREDLKLMRRRAHRYVAGRPVAARAAKPQHLSLISGEQRIAKGAVVIDDRRLSVVSWDEHGAGEPMLTHCLLQG